MRNLRNRNENKEKEIKMVYTYSFKVNRSDELLEFLLRKIPNSRNAIKGLLSSNKILVNGSVVRQFDYPLCKDDDVKVSKYSINNPNVAIAKARNNKDSFDIKKYIIFENENYIAFNKPSGLLSVESDKDNNSLYKYVSEYLTQNDKKARPYILHRIDKDTSGVIVFTKNIELHSKLKMHWNDDVTLREYYAVVSGKPVKDKDTIESFLMENANNLVYSTKNPNGKKAITHYEVIQSNDKYSLLKVTIDTGRKNQIRVHMKDIGNPVVGDEKYMNEDNPINRLGLHASSFSFIDPLTNKEIKLNAKVPNEFYTVTRK